MTDSGSNLAAHINHNRLTFTVHTKSFADCYSGFKIEKIAFCNLLLGYVI